jgi:hypothetical protein
MVQVELRPVEV